MQQSAWPPAVRWDPAAAAPPGELHEALARLADASAILLIAGPEARSAGWASSAAIALAGQVASAQPCVLLDLVLDGGELHGFLGIESLEGVNDIFLYGASLRHVVQHPQDHQFDFAPAGLPGDPELVLTHRRWYRLLGEVKASAAQMLAYVPADAPGLEYLAQRVPLIVALVSPADLPALEDRLAGQVECALVLCPSTPDVESLPPEAPAAVEVATAVVDVVEPYPAPPPDAAPEADPAPEVAPAPLLDAGLEVDPAPPLDAGPALDVTPVAAGLPPDPTPPVDPAPLPDPAPPPDPATPVAREPMFTRRVSDQDFEAIRLPRQGAREKRIADLRAEQRAARMAPPPAMLPLPVETPEAKAQDDVPDAPIPRTRATRKPAPLTEPSFVSILPREDVKSRRGLYIALSLAILAAFAIGGWMFYGQRMRANAGEQEVSPSAQVQPPIQDRDLVPLPYSVAVEAHQELPLAVRRVEALRSEDRNIGFYIAPIQVENVLYYRVMAGPVADSAEASALLRRLLENGHKTGASQWDVLQSPLAFVLGEYDSRSAAEAREREAARLAIPAYVVPVPGPDGNTRQRVYAGAYAGFAEAEIMRQLLRSAGLPDSLVQRVGTRQ